MSFKWPLPALMVSEMSELEAPHVGINLPVMLSQIATAGCYQEAHQLCETREVDWDGFPHSEHGPSARKGEGI